MKFYIIVKHYLLDFKIVNALNIADFVFNMNILLSLCIKLTNILLCRNKNSYFIIYNLKI